MHTCYVPADAVVPGLARGVGRGGARRPRRARAARPRARPRAGRSRCCPGCGPSSRPSRSRTCGSTPRTATAGGPDAEDDDVRRAAAVVAADCRGRHRAAVVGHPGQVAGGADPPARRPHPRPLPRRRLGAGEPPAGFVVTLPKVTDVEQVRAFLPVLRRLEAAHGVAGSHLELQIETPQAVLGADGDRDRRPAGARGRRPADGLHYGTYDYSAALGIAAAHQASDHPAADHAKAVMQVAAAGTGVRAVDGSTNVLPVGADERPCTRPGACTPGWSRRALERGFYQGWDLHPAQLVDPVRGDLRVLPRAALPAAAARLGRLPRPRRGAGSARRAGHRAGAGRRAAARPGLRRGGRWRSSFRRGSGPRSSWISWRAGGQGDPEWPPIVARPAADTGAPRTRGT